MSQKDISEDHILHVSFIWNTQKWSIDRGSKEMNTWQDLRQEIWVEADGHRAPYEVMGMY